MHIPILGMVYSAVNRPNRWHQEFSFGAIAQGNGWSPGRGFGGPSHPEAEAVGRHCCL